jgi:hypothetical protein
LDLLGPGFLLPEAAAAIMQVSQISCSGRLVGWFLLYYYYYLAGSLANALPSCIDVARGINLFFLKKNYVTIHRPQVMLCGLLAISKS